MLCLTVLALAAAQPPAPPAPDSAFDIRTGLVQDGKFKMIVTTYQAVTKTGVRTVQRNGQAVQEVFTYTETVPVSTTTAVPVADIKATDGAGKELTADDLTKRLATDSAVVIVRGTTPLPAAHRKLFKEETLFLVLPAPKPAK